MSKPLNVDDVAEPSRPAGTPDALDPDESPINSADLLERCGGDRGLMHRLLEQYLLDLSHDIAELDDAVSKSDPERLMEAAHAVKGSSATVSANAVRALAGQLERIGQQGNIVGAAACLAGLHTEADRLTAWIRR